MVRSSQNKLDQQKLGQSKSTLGLKQLVDRIIDSGQIKRQEHVRLTSEILASQDTTTDSCYQINRILDYIQMGRIKLID